ncbi:MAG: helicase-related protein [bacterium]|nr:helicase-related protein [bacterium]
MPRILDNLTPEDHDSQMEAALSDTLATSHSLDAAVGYFNLRGWGLIADKVAALPGRTARPKVRLLVGMTENQNQELRRLLSIRPPRDPDADLVNQRFDQILGDLRTQLQVGLPTTADEQALRTLKQQIESNDVDVRLYLRSRLHAKLYLAHRHETPVPRIGYVGSSNLTLAGLREQGELNVDVTDVTSTQQLAEWFEERWNDPFTLGADLELVELLDESWAGETWLQPYLVYLKMAYHLSKEARDGLIRFGLPASMARELLEFQKAAVKIAARIVTERGGVMIGDVVGLGKTLIATAIARLLQEDHGWETLIVCPKNLTPMWNDYRRKYKLHAEVLSLSMVTRKLPEMPRHRLVVVDESHNLRNPLRQDHQALRKYISDNDSKVVLLSATPYNKSVEDLDGQLSLFLDSIRDLPVRPERAIAEQGEDLFAIQCEGRASTLTAFRNSQHTEDWQTLMSQFMVRRTRRFIEDNYAKTDRDGRKFLKFGSGGRFYFPTCSTKLLEREISEDDQAPRMLSDPTLDAVKKLKRPRYNLAAYLNDIPPVDAKEAQLLEDLKRARGNVAGFNRVMMFKRLSSSGPAFLLTLGRHVLRDRVILHAMDNHLPIPVGQVDQKAWDAGSGSESDGLGDNADTGLSPSEAYERLNRRPPGQLRWLDPRHINDDLAEDLRHDIESIEEMLERFGDWDQALDGKVSTLADLILEQHANEKVLIFTEYSDTADYLAEALRERGVKGFARVTGQDGNATELARRFSPGSHPIGLPRNKSELDVLVSTDVLSEGQNLQDARVVVNYDLPWAIIKLVQRAGRVDRIGQESEEVILYTLMPAGSLEGEIDLRKRIRDRLEENASLLGSDERFFGEEGEQELISGLFDEHAQWDMGEREDVDPVSMAYEIWRKASENHPELAKRVEQMPNVVYATSGRSVAGHTHAEAGVLVHSQTVTGSDAFALVTRSGQTRQLSQQEALRMARCAPDTPARRPLADHHELVKAAFLGPLGSPPGKVAVKPTGVRGRCYDKLKAHQDNPQLDLLTSQEEMNQALEDLRRFPLLESATQRLAKALRERKTSDLARLVVDLHREGLLCAYPESPTSRREPRVICSMGFDPG